MSSDKEQEALVKLHDNISTLFNECIMEEIKNNNEKSLLKYDSLLGIVDRKVSGMNLKALSSTSKIPLDKILEIRSKIVKRKELLIGRIDSNSVYTLNKSNINDAASYTGFVSVFRKPAVKKVVKSSDIFKSPRIPSGETIFKRSQAPKESHGSVGYHIPENQKPVRRSLDLPSRPKSSMELKTRPTRRERPKSIDLSIKNQAALLAWDQQPKIPPSTASRNSPPFTSQPVSYVEQRKRYEYVQPTVNTQITLTQMKNKPIQNKRKPSPSSTSTLASPQSNTTETNHSKSRTTEKVKQYQDPKIVKMMNELSGVDKDAVEQILNEIMITEGDLRWDDLAGLTQAKQSLKETVVYPFLRPDLFKGLREPISGMLLFGPPGTGKTMIAKTVANESKSTFFSISASSLLSKYLGESEKLIRALFYVAKKLSPSIIFFDEIDSLLTARGDGEHETSRRVKTEFLIHWSSLSSATSNDQNDLPRVLVLAATNLPWAIDEAARRRFSRRLYIPLPEFDTRLSQLKSLMANAHHSLGESDFLIIANLTEGYSNSDLTALAKEAAMEPIRDLGEGLMHVGDHQEIRGISISDFQKATGTIKKSVGTETIKLFKDWALKYGSTGA